MRIAVITDVHANLPALRAALAEIRRIGVDALYHTGDAVGIGPQPAETLELLLSQPDVRLVMGNHDEWAATGLPRPPAWMSEGEARHVRWVHERLTPTMRAELAGWPYALDDEIGGVLVRFLHYPLTPDGFAGIRALETGRDADELFAAGGAEVVFYGHHHPFSDVTGAARYVNPGALGCGPEAVARFAVLEVRDDGSPAIAFHAAPYDPAPLLAELHRRDVPETDFILRTFMPFA